MVVVDSVAALVPKAELEGDMGDHHIALQVCLPVLLRFRKFSPATVLNVVVQLTKM